jgi:type III pantothenate kinase
VDGRKNGVRIRYEDPRAVGADRIVERAAVQRLYGGRPAWSISAPPPPLTAFPPKAVTLAGDCAGHRLFSGGFFLHRQAAASVQRLGCHGRNTVHAMQSGLLFGYVSLVEGMVARFRVELGPQMKVIATGGLAEIIAQETNVIQIIAPWLTLDGLRFVWEMNHE